jgi:hypothetical protein
LGAEGRDLCIRKASRFIRSQIIGRPLRLKGGGLQIAVIGDSKVDRLFES